MVVGQLQRMLETLEQYTGSLTANTWMHKRAPLTMF